MSRRLFVMKISFVATVFLTVIFGFLFFNIEPIFAQDEGLTAVGDAAGVENTDLFVIIGSIINVFFSILGIIFLILVLYAGFLWMTSAGNADKIGKAKKILINGAIGLVITLSAFAIVTFVFNALEQAGLISSGSGGSEGSIEALSGSLSSGAIKDHYPQRGATDIARNTKIFVTFKEAMNIESFIAGYNTSGTPTDLSDDSVSTDLLTDNIKIYRTVDGSDAALVSEDVVVSFTDDLKTFVFDPPVLGSATEDTNYSVLISDNVETAAGQTPLNVGGYLWTFTVGTELDLTPPTVEGVIPRAEGSFDRNIVVQIDFSEAIDPTSSTGDTGAGFENIQTRGGGIIVQGGYEVSNNYKTITFVTTDACGTNSCGETIFCLPGNSNIDVTIFAATPGAEPPQVDNFPYDGIVDVAANALDGDGDWGEENGEAGDDYSWGFSTTDDVNLSAPEIDSISPDINGEDVDLAQNVVITFGCENSSSPACDSILMSSTISSENISLESDPSHEMWYSTSRKELTDTGEEVSNADDIATKTQITLKHGIFLESTDLQTYQYRAGVTEGIRNQYQNCYAPSEGPNAVGGRCGTSESEPFCCNGVPSSSTCPLF